jgi:hypothetical protein
VNDAVANFTRVGLDDVARSGNTCQSRKLEFGALLLIWSDLEPNMSFIFPIFRGRPCERPNSGMRRI